MKFSFGPSAPEKSEQENSVSNPTNELDKDELDGDRRNSGFQSVDMLVLEEPIVERKHDWKFVEFCPQLASILPGLIILFASGMHLTWGIIEFDLSLWRQDNDISFASGALVVLGWYGGAILGSLIGGVLVIHMGKKFIYLIVAFLLILGADFLLNSYVNTYHIIGRALLGVTYSIAQLTVISYASEATTKRIRVVLLSLIGYVNAVSVLFASSIAYGFPEFRRYYLYFDDFLYEDGEESGDDEYYDGKDEDNENLMISYSAMIIMALAVVVLISSPILARESIPFLIRKKRYESAFQEFMILRSSENNVMNMRSDFELWKACVLMAPKSEASIFKKSNLDSFRLMCSTRLLSLFFNSIILTAIFVRIMDVDSRPENINDTDAFVARYDEQAAVELFIGYKAIQIVLGLALLLFSLKWKINRFCYKMSFVCGMCVCFLYVVYSCLGYFTPIPENFLVIVVMVVLSIFLLLPMRMEIFHYGQIAEAFVDDNSKKIWTIAVVNCIEHLAHIFLMLQIFMFFSYAILLTGFGILYISFWLLKSMPNMGAVHPLERYTPIATKWEHLKHSQSHSVHI